jgi:hypothetical protein
MKTSMQKKIERMGEAASYPDGAVITLTGDVRLTGECFERWLGSRITLNNPDQHSVWCSDNVTLPGSRR